jgi:hypothetical protein
MPIRARRACVVARTLSRAQFVAAITLHTKNEEDFVRVAPTVVFAFPLGCDECSIWSHCGLSIGASPHGRLGEQSIQWDHCLSQQYQASVNGRDGQ